MVKENPTTRRPGRPKATGIDGRESIKRAALMEFARRGFKGTSIDQIAKTAEVAKPLISYHFGSKDQLWKQVVSEAYDEFLRRVLQFVDNQSQAPDEHPLDYFITQMVHFAAQRISLIQISIDEVRQGGERADWLKTTYLVPLQKNMADHILSLPGEESYKRVLASHVIPSVFGAMVFPFIDSDVLLEAYGVDVFSRDYIERQAEFIKDLLKAARQNL